MNLRNTLLLLLTLSGLHSLSQTPDKEYANPLFTIRYPSNWDLDTSKSYGSECILFSPKENASDQFRENANVIIQNLGEQDIDLKKYKEITDGQLKAIVTEKDILESVVTVANGKSLYRVSYHMTQGKFNLRILSYCFIRNDKAYLITFTSEASQYEMYRAAAEKILNSFIVK